MFVEIDNHSVAYCLLGYLCAYFRYYYPVEFITAFLNNAANSDDIENGTELASEKGITISMPKFGYSKGEYSYNKDERVIAKGIGSIKYLSDNAATELFDLAQGNNYEYFCDLICDIRNNTGVDTRQTDILIKLNFFQRFGNERLLLLINDLADRLKYGSAKKLSKETVSSDILLSELSDVIRANSNGKNKDGSESKSFALNDAMQLMRSCEEYLRKNAKAPNYTVKEKMAIQEEYLGYVDLVTGNEEDRKSLYVTDVYPLISKATGKAWGYAVFTKSIGSGKSGRWTIRSNQFSKNEFKKGAIVRANTYHKDEKSGYWYLDSYTVIER